MSKQLTIEQKVDYMRIGMALCGISIDDAAAEVAVRTYEVILEKGGDFNLHDAVKIEAEVRGRYYKKEVSAEPESGAYVD